MTDTLAATWQAWQDWKALADELPTPESLRAAHQAAEDALTAEMLPALADAVWQSERDRGSLLAEIRRATRGRMLKPSADIARDWREDVPPQYRRMTDGIPADSIATELGFPGEVELLRAIRQEVITRVHDHAEATAAAAAQVDTLPEMEALRAEQADELDAAEAAWSDWKAATNDAARAYADAPRAPRYVPSRSARTPGWVRAVRAVETWLSNGQARRATRPALD